MPRPVVVLTSFKHYHETLSEAMEGRSVAVYQPKWYPPLPKLDVFDIRQDGKWTRPRDFINDNQPLAAYEAALYGMYVERLTPLYDLELPDPVALCCWCPYDRAAKRQLKEHGSFVCHTEVVGTVLKELNFQVLKDEDRARMKVL
jgi:hypothetical protein